MRSHLQKEGELSEFFGNFRIKVKPMKKTRLILFLTLFVLFVLAACTSNGETPAPVEVTRVVEVVVTATAETPATETPAPTAMSLPEPTAVPTPAPTATATPEPIDPVLWEIMSSFPLALNSQFGNDGRDLLLVTAQANDGPDNPYEPAAVYPIDEMKGNNSGTISFSTGYIFGTVGQINDGGDVYRFAGPWGGPESRANYTYMVVASNHTTDVGAFQFGLDHYPSGSVAVSSGSPTQLQFAQNIWDAVNHTSGVNDPTQPNPTIGLFLVNAEDGTFRYLELTYSPMTSDWEWTRPVSGQLPLVEDWNGESVFDVLED